MTRVVPPMNRRWFEVLPRPWNVEKPVVAILIPMDWELWEGQAEGDKSNAMLAMSRDRSKGLGLQIFDAKLTTLAEHQEEFTRHGVKVPTPAFIGALSRLPNRLLLDEDMTCLLFHRDEFWRRPIDLKRCWKGKPQELRC